MQETNQYVTNIRTEFGSYNLAANGTVFDPTMTDIDVYLAQAIPEFDEFDQISNTDVDLDQCETIAPAVEGNHHYNRNSCAQSKADRATAKVGKTKFKPENMVQTAEKRVRLNNGDIGKKQMLTMRCGNGQTIFEPRKNQPTKSTEAPATSPTTTAQIDQSKNDTIAGTKSNSLDGISSHIAAELMKRFALAEETVKELVNKRLESALHDDRANHALQMVAVKRELEAIKAQLQKTTAEKFELQQIAERKNYQLEKRDRQLAQAHLDYNDLMAELYNAKYLCDACGKSAREAS